MGIMNSVKLLKKKSKNELGAELVEYALVVSLIAVSCIVAIESFTKNGIMGTFCQAMHGTADVEGKGLFNPDTGECSAFDENQSRGLGSDGFDGWGPAGS